MTWIIYGLQDPRDGQLRYVGLTANLASRMQIHRSSARAGKGRAAAWLCELYDAKLEPAVTVLQRARTPTAAATAERAWIARIGRPQLLNGSDGGEHADGLARKSRSVSMSDKEFALVIEGARRASRNVSQYMRLVLLGEIPR